MRSLGILALLLVFLTTSANAHVSCETVHWAVSHLSKETLNAYIAEATPEQIAEGRACLGEAKTHHRAKKKKRSRA
jgi:hypothetical protein